MIIHLRSYMYSVCTVCSYRISFKNSADNKINISNAVSEFVWIS